MGLIANQPPEDDVYYLEGDPEPEGDLYTRRRMELVFALRHWFDRREDDLGAWVCCNINVHYTNDGNTKIDERTIVTTEVAVAFGVDPAKVQYRGHYRVWDAGAAPCFALEITSPGTVGDDLRVKPKQYAELGVEEYWRFDPTGGDLLDPPLQGERRVSGRWEPIEVSPEGGGLRGRSNVLGLDLCWQSPKLRLWDVTEHAWIPDPDDLAAQLNEQTTARQAAETRAAAAEAEVAELRARLDRTLDEPAE